MSQFSKEVEAERVCDDLIHVASLIHGKFKDKGYTCVNLVWELVGGKYQFCLEFDESEVHKFVRNMWVDFGYTCRIFEADKRRYRWVVIENYNPIELLNMYNYLNNI